MSGRSQDTYLFIDGEYLRHIFSDAMKEMFLCNVCDEDIDCKTMKEDARAKRAFFYDCIDDERQPGETEENFQKRVRTQETFFGKLGELHRFHVRQGSLKGTKKRRRQKEVDVLLAVDMLTHGYDGNMEKAVLIAGDLDFRPVVESLVRRGAFVEVWYEAKSASSELPGAADYGQKLDFRILYRWSAPSFQSHHPLPSLYNDHPPVDGHLITQGIQDGRKAVVIRDRNNPKAVLILETLNGTRWLEHSDPGVLQRYAPMIFGHIDWQ
jgi:uncharacterized LabA/DUF88 family protein